MKAGLLNLALLCLSYISSLLLFQCGFLLKRMEVHRKSECSDVSITRTSCWLPSRYRRAVIILIDALRYDFAASAYSSKSHFLGRLPTISRLLAERNDSAALMRFVADPPTTTVQRLKGLTTGSLPAFIDVGSNFASSAILEDNWVDQIYRSGRNLTLLGDDTWISLFPSHFHRSHHVPSFDINDLHGVDNVILDHLYKELARRDWSVLIAHFLGVDHCGHKYGPDHPEMAKKLLQMDEVIKNVAELIDNKTLLIVMGDHGMTGTGDHGGESDSELDAALFMYSRKKLLFSSPPAAVAQMDLVPTLSLLLDYPIPFSNIGVVIESMIPPQLLPLAVSSNAWQMARYGHAVAADVAGLDSLLHHFDTKPDTVENNLETMRRMQALFRSTWTQFNVIFMRVGTLSLIDAALANFHSIFTTKDVSLGRLMFRSGLFFVQLSTYLLGDEDNYIAILDALLAVSLVFNVISLLSLLLSLSFSTSNILLLLLLAVHSISFLSNSYIVFESSVVRMLTQTVLVLSVLHSAIESDQGRRIRGNCSFATFVHHIFGVRRVLMTVLVLILLRLGVLFERCREEQQQACTPTIFSTPFLRVASDYHKAFRFLLGIFVLVIASISFYRYLARRPSAYFFPNLFFPVIVGILASWTTQWLPEETAEHFSMFSLVASQVVYVLLVLNILMLCAGATLSTSETVVHGCCVSFFVSFWAFLCLLLGDGLSPSLTMLVNIIFLSFRLISNDLNLLVFLVMLCSHGFFALSHHANFPSIPWQAAFVGLPANFRFQAVPGALVIAHIFSAQILITVMLPLSLAEQTVPPHISPHHRLLRRSYLFLFLHSWKLFAVLAAAVIHRRHLMVWKIFAPKFIFESVSFCVICVILVITNCIFHKMNSRLSTGR